MDAPGEEWKRRALGDFREWLESLPDAAEMEAAWEDPEGGLTEGCDLHGLFSELAALRQEVRAQNREQSKAVRELSRASELSGSLAAEVRQRQEEAAQAANERREGFATLERRVRLAAEADCIRSFLEARDALSRGAEAAGQVTAGRLLRFLPNMRKGLAGVAEGYDLALQRFDRVLTRLGVVQVLTVGYPFNPRTMLASRTVASEGTADSEVVEEYVSGFMRGDEVLRLAEVCVNRTAKGD